MPSRDLHLHSASWLIPVEGAILPNAGLVLHNKKILALGPSAALRQRYPQAQETRHPGAALTPSLINAHCHLELSHLAALGQQNSPASFTGWVAKLLALRDTLGADNDLARQAARHIMAQQEHDGVAVLADIGNTLIGRELAAAFPGRLLPFKEYLGLSETGLNKQLRRLQSEPVTAFCSGHALYSTHPRLLQAVKKRAQALGQIFPLHMAEPVAEDTLLREGRGEMADFIRSGKLRPPFHFPHHSGGPVRALYDLGLLDAATLCVHAVHVTPEDTAILAGEGAKLCLCPGSNRFLGVGKAPLPQYLDQGLLPALGTDSLASNPQLSIWREMQLLAEDHPGVADITLFAMATLGGALALGLDQRLGSLAVGKDADFLIVPLQLQEKASEAQLYAALVRAPRLATVQHIRY